MTSDTRQLHLDLDAADTPGPQAGAATRRAGVTGRRRGPATPFEPEAAARLLEGHGDYRVLRRLQPRSSIVPVDGGWSMFYIKRVGDSGTLGRHGSKRRMQAAPSPQRFATA